MNTSFLRRSRTLFIHGQTIEYIPFLFNQQSHDTEVRDPKLSFHFFNHQSEDLQLFPRFQTHFWILIQSQTHNPSIESSKSMWLGTILIHIYSKDDMINYNVCFPWQLSFGSIRETVGEIPLSSSLLQDIFTSKLTLTLTTYACYHTISMLTDIKHSTFPHQPLLFPS